MTFLPDEALIHADYVIQGAKGERSFPPLWWRPFRQSATRAAYRDSPICGKERSSIIRSIPSLVDLNDLPHPDISLIAGGIWLKSMRSTNRVIPIQTSRGCPYNCTFCSVTRMFGRKMRYRDVDIVIEDLRKYDDKHNSVFFYDDNFAADPKRTKRLLRKMIDEGFSFVSSAQVRVDAGKDQELVGLMRDAGLKTVFVGLESVSPESLTCMNKKQTLADMEEGLAGFARYGIDVHGMFVFGFDSDDKKTLSDTVRFAKKKMLDSVQFLVLTPFPGTPDLS